LVLVLVVSPLWETRVFHKLGLTHFFNFAIQLGASHAAATAFASLIVAGLFALAHILAQWLKRAFRGESLNRALLRSDFIAFASLLGISLLFSLPFLFGDTSSHPQSFETLHALFNGAKLVGLLPAWLPMASIFGESKDRNEQKIPIDDSVYY